METKDVNINIKLNTGTVILKKLWTMVGYWATAGSGAVSEPIRLERLHIHNPSCFPYSQTFLIFFIFSRFLYVSRHSLGIIFKLKFGPVFRIRVIFPIRIRTLKNRIRVHQYLPGIICFNLLKKYNTYQISSTKVVITIFTTFYFNIFSFF